MSVGLRQDGTHDTCRPSTGTGSTRNNTNSKGSRWFRNTVHVHRNYIQPWSGFFLRHKIMTVDQDVIMVEKKYEMDLLLADTVESSPKPEGCGTGDELHPIC
ncbi:hypothetical protein JI435_446180 [Parastagonospora nodorum SN15]|uniref:Uncharacterized protein n=1 Tax=Phaeosphaeria nodorum (strain SN15 / ATCC MYA-4574 / FGSC 10173) TaxID=321614 RepID=A0A7U2IB62_PHANO|nr:hypothetical protein JI435_446180 [Parastagonospora nodorum SN15]